MTKMYRYKIVDNSVDNETPIQTGEASIDEFQKIIPFEIFEQITIKGTEKLNIQFGHETFEIVQIN